VTRWPDRLKPCVATPKDAIVTGVLYGVIAGSVLVLAVAGGLPYTRRGLEAVLLLAAVPALCFGGACFGLCAYALDVLARGAESDRQRAEPGGGR
jgi:hypothetical protein